MRKCIAFGVMVVGFLFLLGTVGAAEVNAIGWNRLVRQSMFGLALMIGGGVVSYIEEKREETPSNADAAHSLQDSHPSALRASPLSGEYPLHKGGREEYAAAGKVALGKGIVLFPVEEERIPQSFATRNPAPFRQGGLNDRQKASGKEKEAE